MLSLITTLDTLIQKGVDHAAFAVMRALGVRKSFVSYALTLGVVGLMVCDRMSNNESGLLGYFGALAWLGIAHWERREDEKAEDSGHLTTLGPVQIFCRKTIWAAFFIADSIRLHGWWMAVDVTLTLLAYLGSTPNVPPPKEKRETVMSAVGEGA